jgi:hypothetical protein
MRHLSRIARVAFFAALVCRPASASMIISEIMYDVQGTDTNREWVELYNTGSSLVDLSGWQVGKPAVNAWTSAFPAGTTLGAGKALVVTPSAATLDADWGAGINRLQAASFPSLTNDPNNDVANATLAIRNAAGVVQDAVIYRDGSGWPTTAGNDGNSIYVLPQYLSAAANDNGGNWRPSSQGVYGAYWRGAGGESENHASPGFVARTPQAPFAPSPDAAWSMVVLPDTQNYVARPAFTHILNRQTQWIADNKDLFNIQLVLQEGDVVNRNSGTADNGVTGAEQWQAARTAMSTLDGVVPYIMAAGNHDFGTTSGQSRDTKFNDYFKPADNPLVDPAKGGILKGMMTPGELQNAFYELTAPDGRELLVFSLEMWPRDSVVAWAKGVAQRPEYAGHSAVLLTHGYLNSGGDYWRAGYEHYEMEGGNDGLDLWNKLVKVAGNFEMTFSGHVGGDGAAYRESASNSGDDVHQMLLNSQFETNGGNGWMRVLEFLDDGKTVRVRTYSPHFDLYRTNAANQYAITLSQAQPPPLADFDADGDVDGRDFLVWQRGLGASAAGLSQGDANRDGVVNAADLSVWRTQFGHAVAAASNVAAPEPPPLALVLMALASLVAGRRARA